LTDNSLQSADKDQQEMHAMAEKPRVAVVKFDRTYVSKFTGVSRGPPCDSTASCLLLERRSSQKPRARRFKSD